MLRVIEMSVRNSLRKGLNKLTDWYMDQTPFIQYGVIARRFVNGTLLNRPISYETGRAYPNLMKGLSIGLSKEDLKDICPVVNARERRTGVVELSTVVRPGDRIEAKDESFEAFHSREMYRRY